MDIEKDNETIIKTGKILAKMGRMKEAYETMSNVGDEGLPFISEIFLLMGDIERALIYARKALEKLKEPEYLMESYTALGGVYIKMRDYDKGIKNLEKALLIANYTDNRHWISIINNRIGAIYFLRSELTTAKVYYDKAIQGFKDIGDVYSLISVYLNLGLVFEKEGDLLNAINLYNDALKLSQEFAFDYHKGMANFYIGRIMGLKGDFKSAIDYISCGIEITKKIKAFENLLEQYLMIGMLFLKMNDLKKAEEYIRRGKNLANNLKNEILKKKILILESQYHILKGNPSLALRILENMKNAQFTEIKGDILLNIAFAYDRMNDKKNAKIYGLKALNFFKENASILEIISCYDKLCSLKTFESAKEKFENLSLNLKRRLRFDEI